MNRGADDTEPVVPTPLELPSAGIDVHTPRKGRGRRVEQGVGNEPPAISPEQAARMLVASVRGYKQHER